MEGDALSIAVDPFGSKSDEHGVDVQSSPVQLWTVQLTPEIAFEQAADLGGIGDVLGIKAQGDAHDWSPFRRYPHCRRAMLEVRNEADDPGWASHAPAGTYSTRPRMGKHRPPWLATPPAPHLRLRSALLHIEGTTAPAA
jgi:hypothetical protein